MDSMVVEVEIAEDSLTEDTVALDRMARSVEARLKSVLNVKAEVRMVLPGTLERFEGKAHRVNDLRSYE